MKGRVIGEIQTVGRAKEPLEIHRLAAIGHGKKREDAAPVVVENHKGESPGQSPGEPQAAHIVEQGEIPRQENDGAAIRRRRRR